MRVGTYGLAVALWVGGLGNGVACQCGDPLGLKFEEIATWRLDRATNVVRGRIVKFEADRTRALHGYRVAVGTMKVSSIVKGKAPVGDLKLITAIEAETCGLSSTLLGAVASDREVLVSIDRTPGVANEREFEISSCGYFDYAPRQRASQPKQ